MLQGLAKQQLENDYEDVDWYQRILHDGPDAPDDVEGLCLDAGALPVSGVGVAAPPWQLGEESVFMQHTHGVETQHNSLYQTVHAEPHTGDLECYLCA